MQLIAFPVQCILINVFQRRNSTHCWWEWECEVGEMGKRAEESGAFVGTHKFSGQMKQDDCRAD